MFFANLLAVRDLFSDHKFDSFPTPLNCFTRKAYNVQGKTYLGTPPTIYCWEGRAPWKSTAGNKRLEHGHSDLSLSVAFLAWSVPSIDPPSVRARTVCYNHPVYSNHFRDEKQSPETKWIYPPSWYRGGGMGCVWILSLAFFTEPELALCGLWARSSPVALPYFYFIFFYFLLGSCNEGIHNRNKF